MVKQPLRLAILNGSTREGRSGGLVARWFLDQARRREDFTVDVLGLAELGLPTPTAGSVDPAIAAFSQRIDEADAFVIITPEYNHSFPAPVKHAIDLAYREWNGKPVGFVSYGGMSGGIRAVEHLRGVFAELHTVTVRDAVIFPNVWDRFDASGEPKDPEAAAAAAAQMFDQLAWWGEALRAAKAERPYPRRGA
jgi:NAD(P)H-dependent FMN reductase